MALVSVKVTGRFGITVIDGSDPGDDPDVIYADEGQVRLVPLITYTKYATDSPAPSMLGQSVIDGTIDDQGYLSWNGQRFVKVVDLTQEALNPHISEGKATHRVEFRNIKVGGTAVNFETQTIRIATDTVDPVTGVCDLVLLAPVPTGQGTPIVVGPRGTGLTGEVVQPTPTTMALELTDGSLTSPIDLPAGPGGSDEGVAGYLADDDSDTTAATVERVASAVADPSDPLGVTAKIGSEVGLKSDVSGAMGIRRKPSPTYGDGYVFGDAASFGFAGTGTPQEIAGALGVYKNFGTPGNPVTKTTQAGYVIANYRSQTTDDSAEAFSSAVLLKASGSPWIQGLKTTAFEAIAQVEDGVTAANDAGSYVLGVGSRINVLGSGTVKLGYGFKAGTNSSGGPPYGTIDKYVAFAQPAGSGATDPYGVYVIDPIVGETSIALGGSGWTGQASIKRAGNSDSAVSLAVLRGPDSLAGDPSPRGLTELSLVAGVNQTRSIFEARDSGGTTRFQIGSAGNLFMRGQAIAVADSGGNAKLNLSPTSGLTFSDAVDIVTGTTTGTKIGTGTTQKLGFWGKTPVSRPTLPAAGAVTADDIRTLLIAIGLAA